VSASVERMGLLAREFISQVLIGDFVAGQLPVDPFSAKILLLRAEAAYLRLRWNDDERAGVLEAEADNWEALFREVREADIPYDAAARVSIWGAGTIKNKVSRGEIQGGGGTVPLAALPLSPEKAPALHAAGAAERALELHKREHASAVAEDAKARRLRREVADARDRHNIARSAHSARKARNTYHVPPAGPPSTRSFGVTEP
jgi:hypothetical protein